MKRIFINCLPVLFVFAVSVISVHAEPKDITEFLTIAVQNANHALSSIKKEDYAQATESLNQLEQLIALMEKNTPSRGVEEIISQAEELIRKNELSAASAKLLDARKELKTPKGKGSPSASSTPSVGPTLIISTACPLC